MSILALDLGTKTGWAQMLPSGIRSGVWDLGKSAGERFFTLEDELDNVFKSGPSPDLVLMERPFQMPSMGKASRLHVFGFAAIVHMMCWSYRVPLEEQSPTSVKKHLTGDGKASKSKVLSAVVERYPETCTASLDESDALALLIYGMSHVDLEQASG